MLSDFCDELNKRRKLIAEYIQALIDTREQGNINIFLDRMARHHCQHLASDIDQYIKTVMDEVVYFCSLWSIKKEGNPLVRI